VSEALLAAHGATLTIDLGAIAANWRFLKARTGSADCAAVVKADAYGLGLETVAPRLAKAGCKVFFVAHLSEAVRLRNVLPEAVIGVLHGFAKGTFGTYRQHDLLPVIGEADELSAWLHEAKAVQGGSYILHIDTGMNRLGLGVDQGLRLLAEGRFDAHPPWLVISHFVSSEEPENPINHRQMADFNRIHSAWTSRAGAHQSSLSQTQFSLSNSSGIFLKEKPFYHLVRPGYALYGGNITPGLANPMQPVVRLDAPILQIRSLEQGETVGYNHTWVAQRPSRIATISLGYADGIFRKISGDRGPASGAIAKADGVPCPIAGRVSMDLITVDVTDTSPKLSRGDSLTLLGDGIGVDDMAGHAETNGYNILTNLGSRFARHYSG
jgi:alanine racemase